MRYRMNKTLIALVALSASAMADEMSNSQTTLAAPSDLADSTNGNGKQQMSPSKQQQSKEQQKKDKIRRDDGLPNPSARPVIEANDFDLFGTFLYWHADEEGTDWAFRHKTGVDADDSPLPQNKVGNKNVKFGWDPGFRVGVGYNMAYDQWDSQLYYTWFRTNKNHRARSLGTATDNIKALVVQNVGGDSYSSADIRWKIQFNTVDWDLGRNYFVSKQLAFRPHFGFKGAWINQKVRGDFIADGLGRALHMGDEVSFKRKNNFWGVGPAAGINTNWYFGSLDSHMFGGFGDVAGSLMWGHYTVNHRVFDPLATFHYKGFSKNLMSSMAQMAFGFTWDTNFCDDACHLCVRLGYELQYWFSQNQMFQLLNTDDLADDSVGGGYIRYDGDLKFQGGTLDVRFDF